MFLQVDSLYFRYDNKKSLWVLENHSLSVRAGEIVGIAGPSGQGKSTLLRLIAGLERPTFGRIMIDGKVMAGPDIWVAPENRQVGMVFQDYGLFPHMTVAQNIAYGLHRLNGRQKSEQTRAMLELVHMPELAGRYPAEISGGQQQRVALARALAPRPKLLLLDEPFSNLDAELKGAIRSEMCQILEQSRTTCILVSHDMADLEAVCGLINHMNGAGCQDQA